MVRCVVIFLFSSINVRDKGKLIVNLIIELIMVDVFLFIMIFNIWEKNSW